MILFQGEATFSPQKIFAHPDTEIFFKVTSVLILRYYAEFFSENASFSDFNLNGNYAFLFSIKFRECLIGEVFLSQMNRHHFFKINDYNYFFSCNQCAQGKYSLVNPYLTSLCQSCPNNAFCDGGANLSVASGFWRNSNLSDVILDCLQFEQFCL